MRVGLAVRGQFTSMLLGIRLMVAAGVMVAPAPGVDAGFLAIQTDEVASVELLVRNFESIVFGNDSTAERPEHVSKWVGPVRVRIYGVYGGDWFWLVALNNIVVYRITGLGFEYVSSLDEKPDLAIIVGTREYLIEMARSLDAPLGPAVDRMESDKTINCLGAFSNFGADDGLIERGLVLIATDGETRETESCAFGELLHAIGLRHHAGLIRPSILSDEDTLVTLTVNEYILIRTLYDPRIEPGMPRDEVLKVAREIITELVEGGISRGGFPID